MPHCACFIQISGQSACGTAKYPQTARYAHKTDLTSAARARAHRNPPIWARTASWDASPQPSITNGRISRGDCAQRSSRSATSLPEHERTERRLGAGALSGAGVTDGAHIAHSGAPVSTRKGTGSRVRGRQVRERFYRPLPHADWPADMLLTAGLRRAFAKRSGADRQASIRPCERPPSTCHYLRLGT